MNWLCGWQNIELCQWAMCEDKKSARDAPFLRMNCKNVEAEPKIVKGPPCKLFLCLADLNYRTRDVIKLRRWKLYQQRRNMLPYFISPTVCLCSGVKILYLISQVASSHCVPCSGDIYCGGRSRRIDSWIVRICRYTTMYWRRSIYSLFDTQMCLEIQLLLC